MSSILSRAFPYRMLVELLLSTMILDNQQLTMSMVMIKESLCGKCTVDVLESENDIGLLEVTDGPVSAWDIYSFEPR